MREREAHDDSRRNLVAVVLDGHAKGSVSVEAHDALLEGCAHPEVDTAQRSETRLRTGPPDGVHERGAVRAEALLARPVRVHHECGGTLSRHALARVEQARAVGPP
jgi:hypothetical protein